MPARGLKPKATCSPSVLRRSGSYFTLTVFVGEFRVRSTKMIPFERQGGTWKIAASSFTRVGPLRNLGN
jgi:hypothetical protein